MTPRPPEAAGAGVGPVAVTGALGFVASHLVPRLRARGERVIGLVRPGRDAATLAALGVEVREADLAAAVPPIHAFAGARAVVHLSGMAQVPALLPAFEAAGIARGVFVGSAGIHTRLESRGADAKRRGEAALRASRIPYVILRPSMIYGTSKDRNLSRLLRWIRRCPVVPVPGGGGTPQQPVHVEDLCAAIAAALEPAAAARREYDIGGPDPIPLADLVRACGAALGKRVWLLPLPLGPSHLLVQLSRRAGLGLPVSPEQILRLAESKAVDIMPARRDLGFSPRRFEDGIRAEAQALIAE